jgi:hypothetical protein
MLTIKNTDKLVGESFITGTVGNLIVWKVEGVHNYGPDGQYQIHLRTTSPENDRVFILKEVEGFDVMGLAPYKITDTFEPFNSVWVTEENIGSVTSMLRTLRRIISHANNP